MAEIKETGEQVGLGGLVKTVPRASEPSRPDQGPIREVGTVSGRVEPSAVSIPQQDVVRWLTLDPSNPAKMRERKALEAQYGGRQTFLTEMERRDPTGAWLGKHVASQWPYMTLGATPAGWAGLPVRAAMAGLIKAAEVPSGERLQKGLTQGLIQAGLEGLLTPLGAAAAKVGSWGIERLENTAAQTILDNAKRFIPWWKELPEGQKGVEALLTRDGLRLLAEGYDAVEAAAAPALKGQLVPMAAADLRELGVDAVAAKVAGEQVALAPSRAFMRQAATSRTGAMAEETEALGGQLLADAADVLKASKGLFKKNPDLYFRAKDAYAPVLPAEFAAARRAFSEGKNLVDGLNGMSVIDTATGRFDYGALVKGVREISNSANPTTVWQRYFTAGRAPEARTLIEKLVPLGTQAPERIGVPILRHRVGGATMGTRLPYTAWAKNVPLSAYEREVARLAPIVAGGLTSGMVNMPSDVPSKEGQ